MTWLSGKPQRVYSLRWPPEDPEDPLIHLFATKYCQYPGCWNVLDDQILRFLTITSAESNYSVVYLAKLYDMAIPPQGTVDFVKIATLPYVVHRTALLSDRAGFASLEFTINVGVTLRTHAWNGAIMSEITAHAIAAYGDLVVDGRQVAVCVSSGNVAPEELYLSGSPDVYHRVDYDSRDFRHFEQFRNLSGDQIIVWDTVTNSIVTVQIPQDRSTPITHQANFQFVNHSRIALGGNVIASYGRPSALLKSFSIENPEKSCRTFSHGENFEMDDDIGVVAKSGSSANNDILVNYHHRGSRLTVLFPGLLTCEIDSRPDSVDPKGLHMFHSHQDSARTIEGTINEFLPSISHNRLLASLRIEPDEEGRSKFATQAPHDYYGSIHYLYDFDQQRCRELCNLAAPERTVLELQLQHENSDAQVSVVSRKFSVGIEEEEDLEYSGRPPQAWASHVQELYHLSESRKMGTTETPVLDFDERPTEQEGSRVLFTKSTVRFPDDANIRAIDMRNLALTTSGIVAVPSQGRDGHFFYFEDP